MAEGKFTLPKPIIDQETIAQSIKAAKKFIAASTEDVNSEPALLSNENTSTNKEDDYLHPVYCNDPRKLHNLLNRHVTIQAKNKKTFTGWVQTVDPVSESFILVRFDLDGTITAGLTLVPGYNITGIRLHNDEPTLPMVNKIDALFRNKEEKYRKEEVDRRRDALCVWLKDNRVPFNMTEDNSLEVLRFATIRPPYSIHSITCTNEVVLSKILKLIQDCPNLESELIAAS